MYSKTYLHWLSVLLLLVAVEGCKRDKVEGSSALAPRDTKSNQGAESDAASLPTTEQGRGMSAKARITTGDKAPDFVLPSTSGTTMTLSSALKESAVALVFYRSAVWWPFCKKQLVQLQSDFSSFTEAGVQVIAVSYDPLDKIQVFAKENGIGFPLLSDEKQEVLGDYGLRTDDGYSVPGTYLIGKDGIVHSEFFLDGYKERVINEDILRAAAAM